MWYIILAMARKDVLDILSVSECIVSASSFAVTENGKKAVLEGKVFSEKALPFELERLKEASALIDLRGRLPFLPLRHLGNVFRLCEKGRNLDEGELYCVADEISVANDIKRYFSTESSSSPSLFEESTHLEVNISLQKSILDAIGPDLKVKDSASPKLAAIRKAILQAQKDITRSLPSILSRYASYLTSMSFALKNGHYALPVHASFKHLVRGVVQDISSSENTFFIEPDELLEKNAALNELFANEREEVLHILALLSNLVRSDIDHLKNNEDILTEFDFLQARILYGNTYDGHIGSLSEDGSFYLPSAFHPKLEVKEIVKNDFSFTSNKRILILSGPNAGGKTVALKTVGLCAFFFKLGYLLPTAIGAEVPYFKRVYAEMGDNSSLEDNLSTFSAHISSLKEITDAVGGKDLVLLDELGTGTSPLEGESLAKAILDYLQNKHAYVFLSSHFEGVKEYGLSKPGLNSASMVFDKKNLSPTYHLQMGLPGDSYGLEVASRYGLKEEIVALARRHAEKKVDRSLAKALAELSSLTEENRDLKQRLEKQKNDLEKREKDAKSLQKAIEIKEKKLLDEVEKKKEKILEEAKLSVDEILRDLLNGESKPHKAIEAKKRLEELQKKEETPLFDERINVGDYVEAPSLGMQGKVKSLSGKKAEVVGENGFSFRIDLPSLHKISEPKKESKKEVGFTYGNLDSVGQDSLSLECNLIGLYADEARVALSKYLDRCRIKGFKRVRIIHGFGSGALRKVVREYCDSRKDFIDHIEAAGESEGAGGATVVYLK